jgi:hypothetical protein
MNILRAPFQSQFKIFATMATVAALLVSSAITAAPAQAATFTGDVPCTTGTVQVEDDVVTVNTDCRGTVEIPASVTAIANNAFEAIGGVKDFYLTGITFAAGSLLTTIGDRAFFQNRALASIVIPAGVTSIGSAAFQSTGALTSVTFAAGSALTTIGTYAFNEATALTSIEIPAGVTRIELRAFAITTRLSSVTFAAGSALTQIGSAAFAESGLISITIPSGVTRIETQAFRNASNLSTVTFLRANAPLVNRETGFESSSLVPTSNSFDGISPNAVAKVGVADGGFGITGSVWNNWLKVQHEGDVLCSTFGFFTMTGTTVTGQASCAGAAVIPATATHIGNRVFKNVTSVTSLTFETPSSLGAIGIEAFAGMTGLTSIVIPASVTGISESAFEGTTGLNSITVAAGSLLTGIGNSAFKGTSILTDFTVPSGVTSMGERAFENSGLRRITFLGQTPMVGPNLFLGVPAGGRVFVASGATNRIVAAALFPEGDFGASGSTWNGLYVIKSPDIACSTSGFVSLAGTIVTGSTGCTGSVVIPEGITEIAGDSFYNSLISTITLPNTLISVGISAFELSHLSTVSIPASVTSLGKSAFQASTIVTITFAEGSSLTSIGEYAFKNVHNLVSIEIPASVATIGTRAFQNNNALTGIAVASANSNFDGIGGVLFNEARTKLLAYPAAAVATSYAVPSSVTEISASAFSNATRLGAIEFAANAPSVVGPEAFMGVGAGATARVIFGATGFGDGPTWNGLTIVRAAAPSVDSTSNIRPPVVTPPTVVTPKPVAKRIALSQIVAKVLANGVPVLKGRSASKQVEFAASSARLDATDWATLRKVAAGFKGKKGKLILVGFVNGKGQSKSAAQKVATVRAENVAMALVSLGVDFEIGYAGFGARNKAKPTTIDNRVDFRWVPSK